MVLNHTRLPVPPRAHFNKSGNLFLKENVVVKIEKAVKICLSALAAFGGHGRIYRNDNGIVYLLIKLFRRFFRPARPQTNRTGNGSLPVTEPAFT